MNSTPNDTLKKERPTICQGAIQSMELPARFELSKSSLSGLGMSWLKSLRTAEDKDVEIAFFYRGSPCNAGAVETFRLLLKADIAVVFDYQDEVVNADVVNQLGTVLGNCKNNQISNRNIGNAGPRFYLEKIHVVRLNKRPVMSIQGYFHDPDGDIRNHLMGVFFDASPDDPAQCRIEELVFQAPNIDLFNKYMPDFLSALQTIHWS